MAKRGYKGKHAKANPRTERELRQAAADEGWTIELNRNGHLVLRHPDACAPVYCGSTPTDQFAWRKVYAMMRRALREDYKAAVAA